MLNIAVKSCQGEPKGMEKGNFAVLAGLVFIFLPAAALAQPATATIDFTSVPCAVILEISNALVTIGGTLVIIMFLYGGLKYVFSADDAGGRKQGKTICIAAIIGGILITLAHPFFCLLVNGFPGTFCGVTSCP